MIKKVKKTKVKQHLLSMWNSYGEEMHIDMTTLEKSLSVSNKAEYVNLSFAPSEKTCFSMIY
jgi:hypothetical protein